MKILAIDVGTGTQDIIYYNTEKEVENSIKVVLPSPLILCKNHKGRFKTGRIIWYRSSI